MRRALWLSGLLGIILWLWPPVAVQAMPPHESLEERIERGEVRPPRFLTSAKKRRALEELIPRDALSGAIRVLAVCVDFSDQVHTVTPTFFDNLIFPATSSGQPSVKGYFKEISYGKVDIATLNSPSSLGWVRAPQTLVYYAAGQYGKDGPYPRNCQKLAEDIVHALAGKVDFSMYDNNHDGVAEPLVIIHAGPGAELTGNTNHIWSHFGSMAIPLKYNGVTIDSYIVVPEYWKTVSAATSDMTVGVFAHEMGHGFWDLPDLYDTDHSSYGLGNWSLMAGGSWNGPNRRGECPAWPDAWSRIKMGLVKPYIVNDPTDPIGPYGAPANKVIPQTYNNGSFPTVYLVGSFDLPRGEYYLVENRQQVQGSYDAYLPGNGLLLYHVDETVPDNTKECRRSLPLWGVDIPCDCPNSWHYKVALIQADREYHLEYKVNQGDAGDAWPNFSVPTTVYFQRNYFVDLVGAPSYSTCDRWIFTHGIAIGSISNSGPVMTADLCGFALPIPPPPPMPLGALNLLLRD